MMEETVDSPLRAVADRLGLIAYSIAVSGGRPDWSFILGRPPDRMAVLPDIQAGRNPDPFADTIPVEPEPEREEIAGF